jgi:pyruvate/2-oxoglutarate dehydrogenase complex dihydrolipoamide dehydrogenase (E3) component
MNDAETYDAIVVGGGKGGKTLAIYLARQNYKVALIERDPLMIGGVALTSPASPQKRSSPALDLFIPFGVPPSTALR